MYQLQGGIEKYFKEFPDGGHWRGKNFVFDKREAFGADNPAGVGGVVEVSEKPDEPSTPRHGISFERNVRREPRRARSKTSHPPQGPDKLCYAVEMTGSERPVTTIASLSPRSRLALAQHPPPIPPLVLI